METEKKEEISVFEKVLHDQYLVQKIVKNLGLNQRWNLAACDKKIYLILCELDAFKHEISLSQEQFDDPSTIASIINSKRKFDIIRMSNFRNNNLDIMKEIADIHGENVKELCCCYGANHISSEPFVAANLEAFFKKLPNLIDLNVSFSYGTRVGPLAFENMIGECTAVLKSLKKLRFSVRVTPTREAQFPNLFGNFSSLIASDTIEEFNFHVFDATYRDFIKRQAKIKKIDLTSMADADASDLSHLKLESILGVPREERAEEFLLNIFRDHAATLKELYLSNREMNSDAIMKLCGRLQNLQHLSIKLSDGNAQSFIALDRLKSLNHLVIRCDENFTRFDLLLQLSRLKLESVKKVDMIVSSPKNNFNRIMENIGENWKNLNEFHVSVASMRRRVTISMNGILEHARNLKVLHINGIDSKLNLRQIFKFNGQKYPLIEEFSIDYCHNTSFIWDLDIFPNLQKLKVYNCPYGPSQLKGFAALKKLNEVLIFFAIESQLVTTSDEEISLFKQLCQVDDFFIDIKSPLQSDFCDILAAALSDHVMIADESRQGKALLLASKKI